MIVTVTLDPALLVGYTAPRVQLGAVNQVRQVSYRAGGTGLTVARILHTFGHEVVAAGLAGGASGELIRAELSRSGIATGFTPITLESRRVLEVSGTEDGLVTSFDEPAPYITTEELGRLARDYRRLLDGATAVVLCGGLAAGLPPETYASLASYAAEAGVPAVLAAGGEPLWLALPRHPALVIPDPASVPGPASVPERASVPDPASGPERASVPNPASVPDRASVPDPAPAGLAGTGLAGTGLAGTGLAGTGLAGTGLAGEPDLVLEQGARAVVTAPGPVVSVTTPEGYWRACLPGTMTRPVHDALVAGFVPGIALGWSWPDTLRHAVALAAAAGAGGEVDLARYERLLAEVSVQPPEPGASVPA